VSGIILAGSFFLYFKGENPGAHNKEGKICLHYKSFFVSSTAVNPGLTIMANGLRVGDHILQKI